MEISITKTTTPKQKTADESKLGFGQYYTDHMFIMNYDEGEGWHNPRIVPYGPFELDPAAMVLHYAQEIFEGMKAYRTADGSIQLFRPDKNMARMNVSCDRLCIPKIDEEFAIKAIKTLVEVDHLTVLHFTSDLTYSLLTHKLVFTLQSTLHLQLFFHRSEHIIRKVSHLLKSSLNRSMFVP